MMLARLWLERGGDPTEVGSPVDTGGGGSSAHLRLCTSLATFSDPQCTPLSTHPYGFITPTRHASTPSLTEATETKKYSPNTGASANLTPPSTPFSPDRIIPLGDTEALLASRDGRLALARWGPISGAGAIYGAAKEGTIYGAAGGGAGNTDGGPAGPYHTERGLVLTPILRTPLPIAGGGAAPPPLTKLGDSACRVAGPALPVNSASSGSTGGGSGRGGHTAGGLAFAGDASAFGLLVDWGSSSIGGGPVRAGDTAGDTGLLHRYPRGDGFVTPTVSVFLPCGGNDTRDTGGGQAGAVDPSHQSSQQSSQHHSQPHAQQHSQQGAVPTATQAGEEAAPPKGTQPGEAQPGEPPLPPSPPLLLHALPSRGKDFPPQLQLVDLAGGRFRSLSLLPSFATLEAARLQRQANTGGGYASNAGGGYNTGGGYSTGGEGNTAGGAPESILGPEAMEVAHAMAVPFMEGALTIHRCGEVSILLLYLYACRNIYMDAIYM